MITENEHPSEGENKPAGENRPWKENKPAGDNKPAVENKPAGETKPAPENTSPAANGPAGPVKTSGENPAHSYKVLGGNILLFAVYTLIAVSTGSDGGVAALGLAAIQLAICTVVAIATRSWVWFLSGILVLIIGFGTCLSTFSLGNMH